MSNLLPLSQLGPDAGVVLGPMLSARALPSGSHLDGAAELNRDRPFAASPTAHIWRVSTDCLGQCRLATTLLG